MIAFGLGQAEQNVRKIVYCEAGLKIQYILKVAIFYWIIPYCKEYVLTQYKSYKTFKTMHTKTSYLCQKTYIMTKNNTQKIINYEGVLKIQYIHDERQKTYLNDLFQKITLYLMQRINFVTIKP